MDHEVEDGRGVGGVGTEDEAEEQGELADEEIGIG